MPVIFPYSAQILLENPLFCRQNTRLKMAHSARNSAGRIYLSLPNVSRAFPLFTINTFSGGISTESETEKYIVARGKMFMNLSKFTSCVDRVWIADRLL